MTMNWFNARLSLSPNGYAPPSTLEPAFEDFLGKLLKKVAKGVKAVAEKPSKGIPPSPRSGAPFSGRSRHRSAHCSIG